MYVLKKKKLRVVFHTRSSKPCGILVIREVGGDPLGHHVHYTTWLGMRHDLGDLGDGFLVGTLLEVLNEANVIASHCSVGTRELVAK